MNNIKIAYKKICSMQRQHKNRRKVELINLIINLKSRYLGSIYSNDDVRQQMRCLLRGEKSWSGDVLYYFLWRFGDYMLMQPLHAASYYGASRNEYFSFKIVGNILSRVLESL